MLYKKSKDEALKLHERAKNKYDSTYKETDKLGEQLYTSRKDCVGLIQKIEDLINSISNNPKEFEKELSEIHTERKNFQETEKFAAEAFEAAVKSGKISAIGITGGVAVAAAAPTVAMWVATTFGTTSTGVAISALHGAAATKAALAWLGGGALAAGGSGVAGGQALLALAGPIGWGLAAVSVVGSGVLISRKNKKIADEIINNAKEITIAGAELTEVNLKLQQIINEISALKTPLFDELLNCQVFAGTDYLNLSEDEQYRLGALVNKTLSLAVLLNTKLPLPTFISKTLALPE